MSSLIDSVLALEEKADRMLASARLEADRIAQSASQDIDRFCREIDAEGAAKLESLRSAIEQQLATDLSHADAEQATSLAALDQIAAVVIPKQADRIVNAFLEG